MRGICGRGYDVPLSTIIDEYASLIGGTFESAADAFESLTHAFESYIDVVYDACLILNKKKFQHKHSSYQINYIQPKLKNKKYLPYQRRIY